MKNLSVIIASLDDTSPDRRGIGSPVRFPSNFNQSQQNDTSLPRAPLPGKTPPAGGGGTQVPERASPVKLLQRRCDTMALTSRVRIAVCLALWQHPCPLRLLRRHLSQSERLWHSVTFFSKRKSISAKRPSLPRAPLLGKTPPAGGGGTQVPKGERLSSGCETERFIHYIYSERSQACRP